ncbi:hypothetical protein G5B35_08475 [Parapusillimonas sp. SGNA-6]|nr:hypothetical protein [Parapusillimonas sp. SGNA-6]
MSRLRHIEVTGKPLVFEGKSRKLLLLTNTVTKKPHFGERGNSHAARILMQ